MQDKEQFETLFRSHYGQMLMLAKRLLKDNEEAEDVVSEIFEEVWAGTIHPFANDPTAYLYSCVRNRCLDSLRHLKIKERISRLITLDTSIAIMPSEDHHQKELERIREIVDTRLSDRDRQILLMKYEKKMKYREIAQKLAISETAVYKHLVNALEILRDNLKDE